MLIILRVNIISRKTKNNITLPCPSQSSLIMLLLNSMVVCTYNLKVRSDYSASLLVLNTEIMAVVVGIV